MQAVNCFWPPPTIHRPRKGDKVLVAVCLSPPSWTPAALRRASLSEEKQHVSG